MIYHRRNLASPHNFSLQGALLLKKLTNDASSESQIENLCDFYHGFVLVGSAAAVTFYFNAPLKTETAGDMQTRAHVLSLNSLLIRLFSSDDKVKLMNNPSQMYTQVNNLVHSTPEKNSLS